MSSPRAAVHGRQFLVNSATKAAASRQRIRELQMTRCLVLPLQTPQEYL